jgi:hypothetical protein
MLRLRKAVEIIRAVNTPNAKARAFASGFSTATWLNAVRNQQSARLAGIPTCCDRHMPSESKTHTRKQLQNECSRALHNYVRVIVEGCELLGEVKEGLISDDKRDKIFSHRKQELWAYASCTRARRRLWRFLSDSDPRLARLTGMQDFGERMG